MATVTGSGIVSSVAVGKASISASLSSITASTIITVGTLMGGAIQSVPLDLTSSNAYVGTLAGSPALGAPGGTDGSGTTASFNQPGGITTDGANLYVADTNNNNIRKIVIATGEVTTLASGFNRPSGITTDGTHLYVADTFNNKISKVVIASGTVTTLAGTGNPGASDGSGMAASFNQPYGITINGTNLYVADTNSNKIRKIDITGLVTTLAGSGTPGATDATGTAASFYGPKAITTDGANLYVADTNTNRIRKIVIGSKVVTTLAGSAAGSADGTGTAASFNGPTGITTDGTHLYVADTNSNKIRKIVIATGEVTTLAGSGVSGATNGSGTSALFTNPKGIVTNGASLYVTDYNRIRKIDMVGGEETTAPTLVISS
ncbi:MAG: hypothetical protein QG652_390, partial [Pseudomonadota bacterium]|nr:hypothetical protein [Pseudomonadota bacterium]